MSKKNGGGVSITPRKLNQLVRSYLYRKKLAETLESLQIELLAAIQSSEREIVFTNGETDTCYPIADSY